MSKYNFKQRRQEVMEISVLYCLEENCLEENCRTKKNIYYTEFTKYVQEESSMSDNVSFAGKQCLNTEN